VPEVFNVIIATPLRAGPMKTEVDKAKGTLCVERFRLGGIERQRAAGIKPRGWSG